MDNNVKEALVSAILNYKSTFHNFEKQIDNSQKLQKRKESVNKTNFHYGEEKSKSDEELELELIQAVQTHLKNKVEIKKPTKKTKNETFVENVSQYVSQGAIPKRFASQGNDRRVKIKNKKSKNNSHSQLQQQNLLPSLMDINLSEDNLAEKNDKNFKTTEQADKIKKVTPLQRINPSQPFLYIIPSNPSPYFTLPSGKYFVTTDESDLPPVGSVISHPSITSDDDGFKNTINNLNNNESPKCLTSKIHLDSFSNLGTVTENGADRNYSESFVKLLNKFEEIEFFLLPENFIKLNVPIDILKSTLIEKINAIRVSLENLNILKITEQIDHDLFSKNVFYNKQFGKTLDISKEEEMVNDQFFTLCRIFPNSNREDLRRDVEKCNGRKDLFLELLNEKLNKADKEADVDASFKLLQSQLPDHDLDILYYKWIDCLGNEEKLQKFVEEEKKISDIQQMILLESPELSLIEARKKAENFLNDEKALESFIAERRLIKKIEEQFTKMTLALPENDPAELMAMCQELKGEEDLVNEYILNVQEELKKEAQLLNMQCVLPDAKLNFLKEKVEEAQGNDNLVNSIINSLLEHNDYPKIEQNIETIERYNMWQLYVENFDLKDFLLEIGPAEKLDFKEKNYDLVLKFFQTRYPTKFDTLEEKDYLVQELKNSDMLSLCENYDEEYEYRELIDSDFKNAKFTKDFLKKVVYIDRREVIAWYLQELKNQKKAEEFQAIEQNAFLECPVCWNDRIVESEAGTCSEGHVFCKDCIKRYVDIKIGDGIYKFQCVNENCTGFYSSKLLSEILPKLIFQKVNFKEGAEEIGKAKIEGLEFCTACDFAYIPLAEDKIFYCKNPDCLKETCRNCGENNHIPLKCHEVERTKDLEARKKIEEAMSEKLIRLCRGCGKKFIKIDGCNKMTCTCGTSICYICGKIVPDYSHFRRPGVILGGSCPLYSNNEILHGSDIINAGVRARDVILQQDPTVRILYDPTKN